MKPTCSGIALVLIFLTVFMVVLQWQGVGSWLWTRPGMAAGEWWRGFSGHYVHLGWAHLTMNAIALWLLAALFTGVLRLGDWMVCLLILPLMISGGFWCGMPGLNAYAGLSGVLHGVFALGALKMLGSASERLTGLAYMLLLMVKLAAEGMTGEATLTSALIGGPVLIESHQLGAISGGILAGMQWGISRVKPRWGRAAATKLVP